MDQRISIWREDGVVENVEADQSYFRAEVNHVNKRNFDRNLVHIGPCYPAEEGYAPNKNALYFLTLHPNGFQWDREIMGDPEIGESSEIRPTGWDEDLYYD